MAKGRMISQEAGLDRELNSISLEAQLLYLLTLPHLDRDGLIDGRPYVLGGRVAPERYALRERAGVLIEEWVSVGLVLRYEEKNGPVLFFKGFRKHNPNLPYEKEQASRYAPPPGYYRSKYGLIPNDPELAGRLAEQFDSRSSYRAALMEAAGNIGEHNEVATYSRPARDLVGSRSGSGREQVAKKRREDQDQTEVEEKRTTTTRALSDLAREEMEMVDGWNGGGAFIDSLDNEGLVCLISWLFLYNGLNQDDPGDQWAFASRYKSDPFKGIDNPIGFMRKQVGALIPAPLHPTHLAQMSALIRGEMQP